MANSSPSPGLSRTKVAIAFTTAWLFCGSIQETAAQETNPEITIGSKAFTESIVLGEMALLVAKDVDVSAKHRPGIGGTGVVWNALLSGDIDLYPEYTGTLTNELFSNEDLSTLADLHVRLAKDGIAMTPPLGFDNSYAIAVRRQVAEKRKLKTIADLVMHPDLRFAIGNEFMDREDGWKGLKVAYELPHKNVKGLDHALAYRALADGSADVMDVYATDPQIGVLDLVVLEDNLDFFPEYAAVMVYRMEMWKTAPEVIGWYHGHAGSLTEKIMLQANSVVEVDKLDDALGAEFAFKQLQQVDSSQIEDSSLMQKSSEILPRLLQRTWEHLYLVLTSLAIALLIAFPLGVLAAKNQLAGQMIVGLSEGIMTIPSLALLALIGALFGLVGLSTIGAMPAIVSLFLYSLLPIIRNTIAGINAIPPSVQEAAEAMGLSRLAKLWRIELPLAAPIILTGIKTTAVINVGFAALGGLIGAGGYGATIMTGLRLSSTSLLLEGAIPAAVMAIGVKYLFELLERVIVSPGLRGDAQPA